MPAGLVTAPERLALLLAAYCSVAPFRLKDVTVGSRLPCRPPPFYSSISRHARGLRVWLAVLPFSKHSVGVPPATVTASLRLTVRVTRWPAFRSPLPLPSIPAPELTTDVTVGAVVSICSVPAGLVTAPVGTIQFGSETKRDAAAVLSVNCLPPNDPSGMASMTSLVGAGPARICGGVDDPTTRTSRPWKSAFASTAGGLEVPESTSVTGRFEFVSAFAISFSFDLVASKGSD